jgi:CRP-like cAMP-binding protein
MQTNKLSANGKDHIVKLVTKGELLGQRSMISDEPVNLSAVARRYAGLFYSKVGSDGVL